MGISQHKEAVSLMARALSSYGMCMVNTSCYSEKSQENHHEIDLLRTVVIICEDFMNKVSAFHQQHENQEFNISMDFRNTIWLCPP